MILSDNTVVNAYQHMYTATYVTKILSYKVMRSTVVKFIFVSNTYR